MQGDDGWTQRHCTMPSGELTFHLFRLNSFIYKFVSVHQCQAKPLFSVLKWPIPAVKHTFGQSHSMSVLFTYFTPGV